MAKGAAGVMIAPPPSLRTDDQIVTYYAQAVEAIGSDIPFVIQDYPLTLSVVMTPDVIRRIITDNPSCVMLKHEDWPGLEKISALRRFEKEGKLRRVPILTGNGGLFLDFEMERGADGAMTGYAFPEMLIDVVRLSREGRREEAHDLFDAHLPLVRYEQQQGVGLAVRKYVMMKRGILASDAARNRSRSDRRFAAMAAGRSSRRPRPSPWRHAQAPALRQILGAETPTMNGSLGARLTQRATKPIASSCSSFGASPMMPRMVQPSAPAAT